MADLSRARGPAAFHGHLRLSQDASGAVPDLHVDLPVVLGSLQYVSLSLPNGLYLTTSILDLIILQLCGYYNAGESVMSCGGPSGQGGVGDGSSPSKEFVGIF